MFVLNVLIVLPLGALSPPLETMARGWLGTYWAELNMLDTPGLKVTVRVRVRVRVRVSLTLPLTLTLTLTLALTLTLTLTSVRSPPSPM